ncbi:MAG TPA: guanylate kinase [Actinobacteria bacterium]|nr:guanylate kinase [Actinomycetota bacterium]
MPPRLIVVSGPSGVGKSSIVEAVRDRTGAGFSVSATTRPPRSGERDGVDYHFVGDDEFDALVAEDRLLEWAVYGGHRYGTLRREVEALLGEGRDVILDIENEGAKQVKERFPEAVAIFVLPPSLAELERRLRRRGDTPGEEIARRLELAAAQMAEAPRVYDHIVVNDVLDAAVDEVVAILGASDASARASESHRSTSPC